MKKIFISFLAVAAIASCAKTEEIYTGEASEIKIQPATSISTKANVTAAIDGTEYPVAENFDVYAYWKDEEAGSDFTEGATVYLGVDGPAVEFANKGLYWGGKDQTYYWPKNGSLRFAAYSPSSVDMAHNLATDTYSVDNYVQPHDTDLTWDLLVAPTSASYSSLTAAENVSVVFEHALSWITVQVVAKDAAAAQAFDIKKVTIQDVVTKADLDAVMTEAKTEDKMKWSLSDTKQGYVVYEGSQNVTLEPKVIETKANGTLVIPQPTTSLRVDYSQNALPGTPQLDNQHVVVDLLLDADDTPWKAGKHYVYTLVFGLDEILINPDVVDWDDQVVTEVEVGKTNVYSAEQLAAALTAEDESIDVVLQSDIDLPISSLGQQTGGSGEYKLGGVDTKSITIDLNGKKLNVTTTYWSNLGAKNNDALFTIKDGTMTSSQPTGTWNSYDLTFSNCNYAFENVVFEKAIAFANTNKSATLKDVTIKESHDYYAMWICAAGQNITVDGLKVESQGRGIKIDEQYEDTPAKVTLKVNDAKFQTENKAAILVKSAAGADITLSNVDITKVNADTDFAVWVDEDAAAYADKGVVNGGLCKVEGGNDFIVNSASALYALAEVINENDDYTDANIVLGADIDLAVTKARAVASNWTPVGSSEKPFTGTFDGNGHTIKNLAIVESEAKEGKAYIGFFGYANNATIKNVTFENVTLNIPCLDIDHSQGHIGAVAGSLEGTSTIENVTVKGDIFVEATTTANGASRVAVVAGGNSYGNVTMKNVHVVANDGSYLKANNNVGALAGQLQGVSVFENCSSNIDVTGTKFFAGGIIGLAAGDQKFVNCHTTGDITITAGREGKAHDHYRVGGIAGGWADGATKVCTLTNCTYTGALSGTNADGSVAKTFDYLGYVGRGYTLNGCQGSKVVIDGISFVQKANTAAEAGVYEVTGANGETVVLVSTADELNKLNVKNALVLLNADIDFQGAEMTKPIELWGNSTFDGMGHKISNVKTAVQGNYATSLFRGDANTGNKVVKNLVVENLTTPAGYSFASAIWSDLQGANIEIDNVSINNSTLEATGTVGGFVGFVSGSTTSVVIKNSSINNTNLNGGEADHKRGAVVGRAYGCVVSCDDVVVNNVKINGAAATTSTLVGDKGYNGTVTVK